MEFCSANRNGDISGMVVIPYAPVLSFLYESYKDRINITTDDISAFLKSADVTSNSTASRKRKTKYEEKNNEIGAELIALYRIQPKLGAIEVIEYKNNTIPWDVSVDISKLRETWLIIEKKYIERSKKNKKGVLLAIEHFNIYLFYYLPVFYKNNPSYKIPYPNTPDKLLGPIFISRLIKNKNEISPLTYTEFINERVSLRELDPHYHRSIMTGFGKFSKFIERWRALLPSSKSYTSWFYEEDMPIVYKYNQTNKGVIPRKAFPFVMQFWYSIAQHIEVIINRVVAGDLVLNSKSICSRSRLNPYVSTFPYISLHPACEDKKTVPDYSENITNQSFFGYIPVVFFNGKCIPIFNLPNNIVAPLTQLTDGRRINFPQPHGIYNCIVAFETGIRNNHIQWLDLRTYNSLADSDETITKLFVNTDKVKKGAWTPFVSERVIKILDKQCEWRSLVNETGFNDKQFYNHDEDSDFGLILPLFASKVSSDFDENRNNDHTLVGSPHGDHRYASTLIRTLESMQGYLLDAGIKGVELVKLLPVDVNKGASDLKQACRDAGAKGEIIKLRPVSDITPHSARATVCSHLISVLSADVIGEYVTGQKSGTVYHYVRLDEDDLIMLQIEQAQGLRCCSSDVLKNNDNCTQKKIKASLVNSELNKSMSYSGVSETIASFGCYSLVAPKGLGITDTGIEVLLETNGQGAVVGDTEICPHGYVCPPQIIKLLKGVKKCAICPHAVRSIDHLDAIAYVKNELIKDLCKLENILESPVEELSGIYSEADIDGMEKQVEDLAGDLSGWHLAEEILEEKRLRFIKNSSEGKWHIYQPEILRDTLIRKERSNNLNKNLIELISDATSFPLITSPTTMMQLELLKRQLIANTDGIREAIATGTSSNPALDCAAKIIILKDVYGLSNEQIIDALDYQVKFPTGNNNLNLFIDNGVVES